MPQINLLFHLFRFNLEALLNPGRPGREDLQRRKATSGFPKEYSLKQNRNT